MHKIKIGRHIGNIVIYLTFPTPEIEIPKVTLELASPIQIHSLI